MAHSKSRIVKEVLEGVKGVPKEPERCIGIYTHIY